MITLTIQECRETLYEIVKEKGADYRYDPPGGNRVCVNHHDGKPSCIIGHLLHRLGVPIEQMINGSCDSTIEVLVEQGVVAHPDPSLLYYLTKVQGKQDSSDPSPLLRVYSRNTWGSALAAGDEFLREQGLLS